MNNTNLSVLQQNVLLGIEHPIAHKEFLWACNRHDADRFKYKAEKYAHEVQRVLRFLDFIQPLAAKGINDQGHTFVDDEVLDGVSEYILKRLRNLTFPRAG